MTGDIGSGQRRDDDQAPAVGEGAPHRWGDVPLLVENFSEGVLSRRAYAALACSSRQRHEPARRGDRIAILSVAVHESVCGTFRTSLDVRVKSVMRSKADLGQEATRRPVPNGAGAQ